jgi:hypothetical protein
VQSLGTARAVNEAIAARADCKRCCDPGEVKGVGSSKQCPYPQSNSRHRYHGLTTPWAPLLLTWLLYGHMYGASVRSSLAGTTDARGWYSCGTTTHTTSWCNQWMKRQGKRHNNIRIHLSADRLCAHAAKIRAIVGHPHPPFLPSRSQALPPNLVPHTPPHSHAGWPCFSPG